MHFLIFLVADTRIRPLGEEKLTEILIAVSVVLAIVLISIFIIVIIVVIACKTYFKDKFLGNKAFEGAIAVQDQEMQARPDERPVDVLADSFIKLYNRFRAECDSTAAENGTQQQPQLTNEEIDQMIEVIEKFMEPALHNTQLKQRVFKLFEGFFYRLQTINPEQKDNVPNFLINMLKSAYFSLYNGTQDENQTENLAIVANFVQETSDCLMKRGYKL